VEVEVQSSREMSFICIGGWQPEGLNQTTSHSLMDTHSVSKNGISCFCLSHWPSVACLAISIRLEAPWLTARHQDNKGVGGAGPHCEAPRI
jgi:hypothetical protein